MSLTGGQRNDVTQLMPPIAAIPPVRGRRGRPHKRPEAVYADRGYDHDKYRRQVRAKDGVEYQAEGAGLVFLPFPVGLVELAALAGGAPTLRRRTR